MKRKWSIRDARPLFGNETTLKVIPQKKIEKIVLNTTNRSFSGFGARSLGTYAFSVDKQAVANDLNIKLGSDSITITNDNEVRFNLYEDFDKKLFFSPVQPERPTSVIGHGVALSKDHIKKWGLKLLSDGNLNAISAVRYFSSLSVLSYLIPVKLSCEDIVKLLSYAGRKTIKSLKGLFTSSQGLALGRFSSIHEYHRSSQDTGYAFFKKGIKVIIPGNLLPFKGFISRCINDTDNIQYIVSVFRCAEVITGPLDVSTDTITNPYNGRLTGDAFQDLISEFSKEADIFLERYITRPELVKLIKESNLFKGYLSGKSCPSGKGASSSFKTEFLSLRNYKNQEFYYKIFNHYLLDRDPSDIACYINLLYTLELEFNFNIDPSCYSKTNFVIDILKKDLPNFKFKYIPDDDPHAFKTSQDPVYYERVCSRNGGVFKHYPLVGDLLFLDKAFGGTRTVARANTFFQAALSGGERVMSKLLKLIPQDYTHKQESLKEALVSHAREFGSLPYSSDATAWTDRLPSELNEVIFKKIFGHNLGYSFYSILKGVEYCTNKRTVEYDRTEPDFVSYQVGQGMGLLTSWASSALVHHVLARMALKRSGLKFISNSSYSVLGDDMNIASRSFKVYQKLLTDIGVEFSSSKCTESPIYCEVAKRLFHLKRDNLRNPLVTEVTGYPISEIYRLLDSPIERSIELLNRLSSRDVDTFYAFNGLSYFLFGSRYGGCKSIYTSSANSNSYEFANLIGSYVGVARMLGNKELSKSDKSLIGMTGTHHRFNLIDVSEVLIGNIVDLSLSSFTTLIPFVHKLKSGLISVERNPFIVHAYRDRILKIAIDLSMCLEGLEGEQGLTFVDYTLCNSFLKNYHMLYSRLFPDDLMFVCKGFNPYHYDNFLKNYSNLSGFDTLMARLEMYSFFKTIILFKACLDCFKQLKILSTMVYTAMEVEGLDRMSNQKIRYKCDLEGRMDLVKLLSTYRIEGFRTTNTAGIVNVLNIIIHSAVKLIEGPLEFID
jgi:hypothetical protein